MIIVTDLMIRTYYQERWCSQINQDFLNIVKDTLSNMEEGTEEELDQLINYGGILKYEEERWVLLRFYCWANEANWTYTLDHYKQDIKELLEFLS